MELEEMSNMSRTRVHLTKMASRSAHAVTEPAKEKTCHGSVEKHARWVAKSLDRGNLAEPSHE